MQAHITENNRSIFVRIPAPSVAVDLNLCGILFQCTLDADKEFILHPYMEEISRLFGGSSVEQIFESLEKEGSEWAIKQLKTLKKMVSLLLSFHHRKA